MSYYVMSICAKKKSTARGAKCSKKENNMRFNNSSNGAQGRGYEEFSRFLRGDMPTYQKPSETVAPRGKSLAMVYPEKQKFIRIYDPEIALVNGTMFEELFMPFNRGSCRSSANKGEGC